MKYEDSCISYPFKGASIATRAASKWGGVLIKLSGLSPCLLYSVFYFNSVVCCLLSVSIRNSNNISRYVYNRELITQPKPISHSPNFESDGMDFFSNTCLCWVIKNILVSIISVTFNLDACKVSFLNYL